MDQRRLNRRKGSPRDSAIGESTGLRLRTKLSLFFTSIFAVFAVAVIGVSVTRTRDSLLENSRRYIGLRTQAIANLSRLPLLNANYIDLQQVIDGQTQREKDLLWVAVIDGNHKTAAASEVPLELDTAIRFMLRKEDTLFQDDNTPVLTERMLKWNGRTQWVLEAKVPVLSTEDHRWGSVHTILSLESINERVLHTAYILLGTSIVILLLGCGVILVVSRHISNPIEDLAHSAHMIATGCFDEVIPARGGGEIGTLFSHFSKMASNLTSMKDELVLQARESEGKRQELDTVLSSLMDGVMAVNSDLTIRFVNDAARSLLELSSDDLTNASLPTVIVNTDLCDLIEEGTQSLGRSMDQEIEMTANKPSDHPLTLRVRINPISCDLSDSNSGTVVVLTDVTKLRLAQQTQKRLLTNVSHELRTPVSVLKLAAANLKRYPEMAAERRLGILDTIDRESARLKRMIDDLLDISRLEVKGLRIELEDANLQDIVDEVLTTSTPAAKDAGVFLRRRATTSSVPVQVDTARIFQVVNNLVRNAINFTQPGHRVAAWTYAAKMGRPAPPMIGDTIEGSVARICVFDQGRGIEKSDVKKVFDRFYRVENEVHTIEGTGVGLAIVKEIVLKHHGAIHVMSEPNRGTLFVVELPVNSAPRRDSDPDDDSTNKENRFEEGPPLDEQLPGPGALT